jgi:hypothetical protein
MVVSFVVAVVVGVVPVRFYDERTHSRYRSGLVAVVAVDVGV